MIEWYLGPIENYLPQIKDLFKQNTNHKHADNYTKWTLFDQTKFSRIGFVSGKAIYYSAGIERPQYNGGIRIMSRHTRSLSYDFGDWRADLERGLDTLDQSTKYALALGYKDIWLSREESPKLFEYFVKNSNYNWNIEKEEIVYYKDVTGTQWVMRLKN